MDNQIGSTEPSGVVHRRRIGLDDLRDGLEMGDVLVTSRATPPDTQVLARLSTVTSATELSMNEASAISDALWATGESIAEHARDVWKTSTERRSYGQPHLAVLEARFQVRKRRLRESWLLTLNGHVAAVHYRHSDVEADLITLPGVQVVPFEYLLPAHVWHRSVVLRRIDPFADALTVDRLADVAVRTGAAAEYDVSDLRRRLNEPESYQSEAFLISVETSEDLAIVLRDVGFASITYDEGIASVCLCVADPNEQRLGTGSFALRGLTELASKRASTVEILVPVRSRHLADMCERIGFGVFDSNGQAITCRLQSSVN